MSNVTSSYDGYTFYDDGSMVGPDGATWDVNGNPVSIPSDVPGTTSTSGDMGWLSSLIGYGAKTALDTWKQTTLMEQNQQGQRYIAGSQLAAQQMQLRAQYGAGGISPMILLLGLGVVAVVLMKS